ncbi:hypothetical protein TRFO_13645 [Tritrichomonas foetus]|uniref:Ubiquitin-like domain-containing protein n=1 Tax=Tritrichomonas foetus TaxID=1144522 RepID=A0A1J4L1Y5_9EUKA|nr:hypothetical protein TRFO_13645 [Tritrichomonas foetus]|eukprot:OHT15958.1 hypothetical protein TRFO_13645 [Tritrichomonas foetus]
MDDEFQLTIKTITGKSSTVVSKRSATVRSLLASAGMNFSPNSYPIFLHKGNVLNPDLSLAKNNLQQNDTIILMVRKAIQTQQITEEPINNEERQQKVLFEEALRVSDVAFVLLESSRSASTIYRSMIESQEDSFSEDDENTDEFPTNLDWESNIARIDPLPVCWSEDSEDDIESNEESDTDFIEALRDRCPSGAIVKPNCGNEW